MFLFDFYGGEFHIFNPSDCAYPALLAATAVGAFDLLTDLRLRLAPSCHVDWCRTDLATPLSAHAFRDVYPFLGLCHVEAFANSNSS